MDCFEVCPELQVIRPALKGAEDGAGPLILDANCTNCGRCIDVCSKDVFNFDLRFNNTAPIRINFAPPVAANGNPNNPGS
jgi:ferredoxin-type protein NapH